MGIRTETSIRQAGAACRRTGGDKVEMIELPVGEARDLAYRTLTGNGLGADHARVLAESMTRAQGDDCQSHGLYRLIMCVNTLRAAQVAVDVEPQIHDHTPSVVIADARHAFSLLAFERSLPLLAAKAKASGIAALVVRNCYHFSALWPEVEAIAAHGLVGVATNPSHSWVAPFGGREPLLGTNPLAFAWPRPDGPPFVFDFATSAMARGDLELHRQAGKALPSGTALDADGHPTTDPEAALSGSMLPFGGYKGSALSLMIELMAGPLIGDLTSRESMALDNGQGGAPVHGQLILAFDPSRLGAGDPMASALRAEALLDAVTEQGARLPSQRRYLARAETARTGKVRIGAETLRRIRQLGHL
jgi:delta1-piperideine-2-carboxylate reductase